MKCPLTLVALASSVWLGCLASIAAAQAPPGPAITTGTLDGPFLEATLDGVFKSAGVRAGALVVVRDGVVIFQRGYGTADAAKSRPVDPETTVFRAASNGKVMVATLAAMLAAEGTIDPHADINSTLRTYRVPPTFAAPVTLDDLLTHTAGFEDRFLGGLAPSPESVTPLAEYLSRRMPARVAPPGAWMAYSNHGMALAGLVLQDAAGVRFDDLAEQRIFAPLGMTRSTFKQPPPGPVRDAIVWDRRGDGPWFNPYPAGSIVTTAADMGRFLIGLLSGRAPDGSVWLTPAAREQLIARHYSAHPSMPGVAYGFFEGVANSRRTLHHTGDGGHHSLIWIVPDAGLGVFLVYTTPTVGTPDEPRAKVSSAIADRSFGPQTFQLPKPLPDATARASRFAGIYRPNQHARTTIEKLGALPAQITVADRRDGTIGIALGLGAEPETFIEVEPRLFRSADGAYVTFAEDAAGRVTGLHGTAGTVDDPLSAERIGPLDDSRVHLAAIVFAAVAIVSRLLATPVLLIGRMIRRLRGRAPAPAVGRAWTDGLGWRVSGVFSLLCAVAPAVALGSVVAGGGPIYRLPTGVFVALSMLAVAAVLGLVLVPLAVVAWRRRDGSLLRRVHLSILAIVGVGAAPFLFYWNLLGFHV